MLFRMIYCSCKKNIHIIIYIYIGRGVLSVGEEKLVTGHLKNKGIVHKNWGRVSGYVF